MHTQVQPIGKKPIETEKAETGAVPQVSIGMPVYNGGAYIRTALDSLLLQRFSDFELLISDNASSDSTADICKEYCARDSRVLYVRQPQNIGAMANFEFVKNKARGSYFMWAAADDYWKPEFINRAIARLQKNKTAVAAICNSKFGEAEGAAAGCAPNVSSFAVARRIQFLMGPGPNARFYSLFRLNSLASIDMRKYDYNAGDWAFVFDLLGTGCFDCDMDYLGFFKDNAGAGSAACLPSGWSTRNLFPLFDLWRHVFTAAPISSVLYLPMIARLNWKNRRFLRKNRMKPLGGA